MRSVSREPAPLALAGKDSSGPKERAAAIAFYSDPANKDKSFDGYAAYKDKSVVSALARMFRGKCCYCESQIAHVMPADIEHYRPKGAYIDHQRRLVKPGYYWLGAEWSNLLLACIDCNRARNHDNDAGRELLGKANLFPLADEALRGKGPGQENREEPLLLDPCRDRVEEHLEFVEAGVVRPALRQGQESQRGRVTIEVVGLRRRGLVGVRATRLAVLEGLVRTYRLAVAGLDASPGNPHLEEILANTVSDLKKLVHDDAEFTLMQRQRLHAMLPDLVELILAGT